MGVSKIVYGGQTLIDLTSDTITKDKLLKDYTAHGKDGEAIVGTCEFDVNSQDATVAVAEILKDKTAYARGSKLVGTMPNNGAVDGSISTKDGKYKVPQGYHDGSGSVEIADSEKTKLVPNNIRDGITILGVTGNMSGTEGAKPQMKEVTSSTSTQVVLPDDGYNYLSQVTVNPIPYVENDNSAGGKTVTIG